MSTYVDCWGSSHETRRSPQQILCTTDWPTFWQVATKLVPDHAQMENPDIDESVLELAKDHYTRVANETVLFVGSGEGINGASLISHVRLGEVVLCDITEQLDQFEATGCNNLEVSERGKYEPYVKRVDGRLAVPQGICEDRLDIAQYGSEQVNNQSAATLQSDERLQCPQHWPFLSVYHQLIVGRGGDIMSREYFDQIADQCTSTLHFSPERFICFGVITDLESCVFVAVTRDTCDDARSGIIVYSERIDDFVQQMALFAATSVQSHGLKYRFPLSTFQPLSLLGEGSTGMVMQGRWISGDCDVVMKLSDDAQALKIERMMLSYLCDRGMTSVPRIHTAAQAHLDQTYRCSAHCNIMEKQYLKLTTISLEQAYEAWAIVQQLHAHHVVHNDVRSPNFMIDPSQPPGSTMVLVDFSSARIMEGHETAVDAEAFNGLTHAQLHSMYEKRPVSTASDAVLLGAPILPADEGCSMIYCIIQSILPEPYAFTHFNGSQIPTFIRRRKSGLNVFDSLPEQEHIIAIKCALQHLHDHRETCTPDEITAQVHLGIAAVFRLVADILAHPAA